MVQFLDLRHVAALLVLLCCVTLPHPGFSQDQSNISTPNWAQVKSVLDRRCVACHSCYDAPCQAKLTSIEGIIRGGSKAEIYHADRLTDAPLTRLGFDAQSVAGWREKRFFPITRLERDPPDSRSLIEEFLALGREHPFKENNPLPKELPLSITRSLSCPTVEEFAGFRKDYPLAGMPYGMAPLPEDEFRILMTWAQSDPGPAPARQLPQNIQEQISDWENFLNKDDLRSQLMSRYLYEHLFLARLHFAGDASRTFFEIVRSSTPTGQPIKVIATRRPFDDPGGARVYYRLRLVTETLVHKQHLVYHLGPGRMDRYRTLFLDPEWMLDALPEYGLSEGGNPFSTFAAIPARSRYQFLLDDALFFVRSFIRGPVCHGQTAVDVIEDRFWVSFLAPDADLSVTDPSYLAEGATYLELPVVKAEGDLLDQLHSLSHDNQVQYLEFRDTRYSQSPKHDVGFGYDDIWDGERNNANALITVFRHFDNASAITGLHGDIPETAWVIDYPIFERIYYNLVAGFDVFGRVEHQISTRLYMDELRMEGEDTFLAFMPADMRAEIHREWYQGFLAREHTYWHQRRVKDDAPTGIDYTSSAPKSEFFLELLRRGDGLWPINDPLNRCRGSECDTDALTSIASKKGPWVKFLPDLSVLVVEHDDDRVEIFTLIHDKAHKNVAFLFREEARREFSDDTVTILPGMIGSYPNFFFVVNNEGLTDFTTALTSMKTQDDWMDVVAQFGIRRTHPDFWATSDRLNAEFLRQHPIEAGLLDLNRYKDPKPDDEPS